MTQNNLVLSDSQKLDAVISEVGMLVESFNTLCKATQDLVDKLAIPGTPTRPTVNQSAKTTGTTTPTPTQQQTAAVTIKIRTMEDIISSFPKEIADKLDFSLREKGSITWIKPKDFLGSEIFRNVNLTIRAMGGEYHLRCDIRRPLRGL